MRRCARRQNAGKNRPRGGVRDSLGAQGVKIRLVLAAVLDVFEASAVAKGVERDVQHVVRLVVGQVDPKEIEVAIDRVNQP